LNLQEVERKMSNQNTEQTIGQKLKAQGLKLQTRHIQQGAAAFVNFAEIGDIVKGMNLRYGEQVVIKPCSKNRGKDVVVIRFLVSSNVVPDSYTPK